MLVCSDCLEKVAVVIRDGNGLCKKCLFYEELQSGGRFHGRFSANFTDEQMAKSRERAYKRLVERIDEVLAEE